MALANRIRPDPAFRRTRVDDQVDLRSESISDHRHHVVERDLARHGRSSASFRSLREACRSPPSRDIGARAASPLCRIQTRSSLSTVAELHHVIGIARSRRTRSWRAQRPCAAAISASAAPASITMRRSFGESGQRIDPARELLRTGADTNGATAGEQRAPVMASSTSTTARRRARRRPAASRRKNRRAFDHRRQRASARSRTRPASGP